MVLQCFKICWETAYFMVPLTYGIKCLISVRVESWVRHIKSHTALKTLKQASHILQTHSVSRANPLIYSILPYHAFIQPELFKNPMVKVVCLRTRRKNWWKIQRLPSYRQQSRWDDWKMYKSKCKIDCDMWHREVKVIREFSSMNSHP